MDPYALSKFGNVTIQRVLPKPNDPNEKFVNEKTESEEISENISPQLLNLPKLPPSINITIKSCTTSEKFINNEPHSENIDKSENKSEIHAPENKTEVAVHRTKYLEVDEDYNTESRTPSLENCNYEKCDLSVSSEVTWSKGETSDSAFDNNVTDNCNIMLDTFGSVLNDTNSQITLYPKNLDSDKFFNNSDMVNINETDNNISKFSDEIELPDKISNLTDDFKEIEYDDETANIPENEFVENDTPNETNKDEHFFNKNESDVENVSTNDQSVYNEDLSSEKKRKGGLSEDSDDSSSESKKQKIADDSTSSSEEKDQLGSELKVGSMRRNIREVMDETKLDEATLAAQRQEMERLRRVQEQQRILRDVQKQIAQNRQNSKMQARVLSLLQKGSTSLIKKGEESEVPIEDQKPAVVVKLSTGSGPPQIINKKMLDILKNQNSSLTADEENDCNDKFLNISKNLNKPQMMTPSVSIAPVKQEIKSEEISESEDNKINQGKDVIMVSSSSGEEDDCIVISEEEEEEESEQEDDTSNSGMHTNDLYNVPDDQGRVLINVGHPENEKDVFLAPQIARVIKPHQIGGVRFLFDNIVESLERYKTSEGFGCILAHSMGLGKTLQVISFCDVFLRYTEGRSVLCIMPINTLQNWVAEFNMWLPVDTENSPLREHGEVLPRQFPLFVLNDNQKTLSSRAKIIESWHQKGGVLLIGYELYRQLSFKKPPKSRTRSKRKVEVEEDYDDDKSKTLLELMYNALVKPGPDLVICDEGHRIKNSHASISQALKQIRSKRRVVLTGYPLQNNLLEYWCMVDFVRPNYLGTKTEFSNMFERPIQNGQCIDSTPQDIKLMRYRAHVLHSLLEGFVQRRSHLVLQQTLPCKYEFVLLLRLTTFQRKLYSTFMNEVVRTKAVPNPLKAFAVCCKIWNHPDILYNFLKKRAGEMEEQDLDLEETVTNTGTPASSNPSTPMTPSTPPHQTNKRNRSNRTNRGSQRKDSTKLPRKNARLSASQAVTKQQASICTSSSTTNDSNGCLSTAADQSDSNNQQAISTCSATTQFNNSNQNETLSNEAFSYSQTSNSNSSSQNFNAEYGSSQDFNTNINNNQDYSNINYQQQQQPQQQTFNDGNYYQPNYAQSNYWNSGNNDYNSTQSQTVTDKYYQQQPPPPSTSLNNNQYISNDYVSTHNEQEPQQQQQTTGNFNYNLNQQLYTNEYNPKQDSLHFNDNYTNSNQAMLSEFGNTEVRDPVFNTNDMNYNSQQSCSNNAADFNQSIRNVIKLDNSSVIQSAVDISINTDLKLRTNDNESKKQGYSPVAYNVAPNGQSFHNDINPSTVACNSFMSAQSSSSRIINPAVQPSDQFGNSDTVSVLAHPRLPVAGGKQRRNINYRGHKNKASFKHGLPGGAPILKAEVDGREFQITNLNQQHTLYQNQMSNTSTNESTNMYGSNSGFLENLHGDELWSTSTQESAAMFTDQNNYSMYNNEEENCGNKDQFLSNVSNAVNNDGDQSQSILSNVCHAKNILGSEMQNDEIFNSTNNPPDYSHSSAMESNLFNFSTYSYLNDLQNTDYQMSGATSFMGLLEGPDETLELNQKKVENEFTLSSANNQVTKNFATESNMTTFAASTTNQVEYGDISSSNNTSSTMLNSVANVTTSSGTAQNDLHSVLVENDVSQCIIGLKRKGQITLKMVDKNETSKPLSVSSSLTTDLGSVATIENESKQNNNSVVLSPYSRNESQNNSQLPSIGIFNSNQNFTTTETRLSKNQDNENFTSASNRSSFVYMNEPTTASSTIGPVASTSNWNTYDDCATVTTIEYKNDKSLNVENKTAAMPFSLDQNTVQISSNASLSSKIHLNAAELTDRQFTNKNYSTLATANPNLLDDNLRNKFVSNQNISLINLNDQKREETASNRNFLSSSSSNVDPDNVNNLINVQQVDKKQSFNQNISSTQHISNQLTPDISSSNQQHTSNITNMSTVTTNLTHFASNSLTSNIMSSDTGVVGNSTDISIKEQNKITEDELENSDIKMSAPDIPVAKSGKEEPGIPYDWTNEFFNDYEPGKIEASAKTLVFFCLLDEIIRLGDRLLLFSQSLFTLDLIEDFLQLYNIPNTEEKWTRNKSYFRLDGSTSALEREKLINEFNNNPSVHLFLVSTRAGSLGINLVGANRVIVFDASWNPCHDTQAVCRVYRYGQQKSCYVYRFVMDNCLEKKIYDRQINKQGMSDRVVDECNPDAHLTIKDVSNLCYDSEDIQENKKDFNESINKYNDVVIRTVIEKYSSCLSKEPFQHESLLIDRKDKKLSQAEKRMAKRSYELEKQACLKPTYGFYNNQQLSIQNRINKPMTNIRPMQSDNTNIPGREPVRRWIPADVWQKQGMSAQEMTLPLDVVIPTSTTDSRSSIVLKAGQKVMVLKSPKGIYMQLENGKIIAIKTTMKTGPSNVNKPGMIRNQNVNHGPVRMVQRPQQVPLNQTDRTLVSLGNRRDVTVSPIRNRYNPRANLSMPMNVSGGASNIGNPACSNNSILRNGLGRNIRQGQPIVRTFPLPRPQQNRFSRHPAPTGKQYFGSNSSVTISLANKKNTESQEKLPVVSDYQQQVVEYTEKPVLPDERIKNIRKEDMSQFTEISYDDLNNKTGRSVDGGTGSQTTIAEKRISEMNKREQLLQHQQRSPLIDMRSHYNDYVRSDIVEGFTRRSEDTTRPYGSASSTVTGHTMSSAKNISPSSQLNKGSNNKHLPVNNPSNVVPASNKYTHYTDILPESLRHKKDINLVPVKSSVLHLKSDDNKSPKMSSPISSKLNTPVNVAYHHHHHQHSQHTPSQMVSSPYQLQQHHERVGTIQTQQQVEPSLSDISSSMPSQQHHHQQQQQHNIRKSPKALAKNISPHRNIMTETLVNRKDVQLSSVKTSSEFSASKTMPGHHSISIFPVNKKSPGDEDISQLVENQQSNQKKQSHPPKSTAVFYQNEYSSSTKQYPDYYPENESRPKSQYSFDTYRQNYPSQNTTAFSTQIHQSAPAAPSAPSTLQHQQQQIHQQHQTSYGLSQQAPPPPPPSSSYSETQYPNVQPYLGQENVYSSSDVSFSNNTPQYTNSSMPSYVNTSQSTSAVSNASSYSQFEQPYSSYYTSSTYQQQPAKNESQSLPPPPPLSQTLP